MGGGCRAALCSEGCRRSVWLAGSRASLRQKMAGERCPREPGDAPEEGSGKGRVLVLHRRLPKADKLSMSPRVVVVAPVMHVKACRCGTSLKLCGLRLGIMRRHCESAAARNTDMWLKIGVSGKIKLCHLEPKGCVQTLEEVKSSKPQTREYNPTRTDETTPFLSRER